MAKYNHFFAGVVNAPSASDPIADLAPLYYFDATTQVGNSSDSLSPTSDTRIAYWGDKSGNGHHLRGLATTATFPQYHPVSSLFGNKPTLQMTTHTLKSDTPSISGGEWTAFVVAQNMDNVRRSYWITSSTGTDLSTTNVHEIRSQTGVWRFQGFGVAKSVGSNTTGASIYLARVTSGRGEAWENGGSPTTAAVNTTSGTNSVGIQTGRSAEGSFWAWQRISAIVGWSSGLSNSQLNIVGAELADRFGQTWSNVST